MSAKSYSFIFRENIPSSYFLFRVLDHRMIPIFLRIRKKYIYILSYNLAYIFLASLFFTVTNSFWSSHHPHTPIYSSLAILTYWFHHPVYDETVSQTRKFIYSSIRVSSGWSLFWQIYLKSSRIFLSLLSRKHLVWLAVYFHNDVTSKTFILVLLFSTTLPSSLFISR